MSDTMPPDGRFPPDEPTIDSAWTEAASIHGREPAASGFGERPGDRVGPYHLQAVIGEGGFGVVWLAERREPMVQRVALKIIKPGMDSHAVVARFEQERQALAMMEHPNIARVLDGGITERGRPYFVMEHVNGEPITTFCDRRRLSIRQRLDLVLSVCDAVQHAHTKGIIHRDLKPGNILVAAGGDRDGADGTSITGALVKVIDFGVAKAVNQALDDKTIFTVPGQVVGTPEYMSPEQAEAGASDVDTRTDVYALGVVLYELLCGALPFDSRSLRSSGIDGLQRLIRETDPPRPSTLLQTLDPQLAATIASARRTAPKTVARELKSELEWIPLKALRKDRSRRYASPEALGADIRRYLEGRPLEAAPESRAYLVGKFVRRNRLQVASGAAVIAALIIGLGAALWQAGAARSERDRAVAAEKAATETAGELSAINRFQLEVLKEIASAKTGVGLLQGLRERVVAGWEGIPLTSREREARLCALDGELALVNPADLVSDLVDTTIVNPALANLEAHMSDVLAESDSQALVAAVRHSMAIFYDELGMEEKALPIAMEALAARRLGAGNSDRHTIDSILQVGALNFELRRYAEAEEYYREALELSRRHLGPDHFLTLNSVTNLGTLLVTTRRLEEAEPFVREAMVEARRIHGDGHDLSLVARVGLARVLSGLGKVDEAAACLGEGLAIIRDSRGNDSVMAAHYLNELSHLEKDRGDLAAAASLGREAVDILGRTLGREHSLTREYRMSLGLLLLKKGDYPESEPILRENYEQRHGEAGTEDIDVVLSANFLGVVLARQGRIDEAELYLIEALESGRRLWGAEHPDYLNCAYQVADLRLKQGRHAEAEHRFLEILAVHRRVQGPEHPNSLKALAGLGSAVRRQGRDQEAFDLLRPTLSTARDTLRAEFGGALGQYLATVGLARLALADPGDPGVLRQVEAELLEAYPLLENEGPKLKAERLACSGGLARLHSKLAALEPGADHAVQSEAWSLKAR